MTAKILRALPLSVCFLTAAATAESLTVPVLSGRKAFDLFANSNRETKRDDSAGGRFDDLLYDREVAATGPFERLFLVEKQRPTGVLMDIVINPAGDTPWWRSGVGGMDWRGLFYMTPETTMVR